MNGNVSSNSSSGLVSVVLGAQWGDEGKGKLVDLLAEKADVVARCQVSKMDYCSIYSILVYCLFILYHEL